MVSSVEVARAKRRGGSPVAHLVFDDGQAWSLHFTPEQVTIGGIGWKFAEIERQGRKPLVRRSAQQVRTLSFSHTLGRLNPGDMDPGWTPTVALRVLMGVPETGRKVRLINVTDDIETRGWWYADLSVKITERDTDQQVKTAELTWTLTEANDERPEISRIPPPPPPTPPPAAAAQPTLQPDYTVVRGDSLWKIAARFLGDGNRWRQIYDLNQARLNLKPPQIYAGLLTVWIYPGQVLRIPQR